MQEVAEALKRLLRLGRITRAYKARPKAKTMELCCPATLAQSVYDKLWPLENKVTNSVTPDPVHR